MPVRDGSRRSKFAAFLTVECHTARPRAQGVGSVRTEFKMGAVMKTALDIAPETVNRTVGQTADRVRPATGRTAPEQAPDVGGAAAAR